MTEQQPQVPGSELIAHTMTGLLGEARAGDAAAAAMTAILIHMYPDVARETGASVQYEWLLAQCLQTKDPELLACVGEELMSGKRLAQKL